ncbi:MAG: LPS assembly protein LptD [Aeromonas sp.]
MSQWTHGFYSPIALTLRLAPALAVLPAFAASPTPPPATGQLDSLCYAYVPAVVEAAPGVDANMLPVEVDADRLEAKAGQSAVYEGEVNVRQGLRKFNADYAKVDQASRDVIAIGNIYYNDGRVTVTSDKTLTSNLDSKDSELIDGRYQVHGSAVRGAAKRVSLRNNNQNIRLEGAQYTTCPPGQETWLLKASEIDIDQQKVFGHAWGASLWLYDTPVFYFPYINFPIKDERKTGLLYPSYRQSSGNGMEIAQPFYWNIAPNYDATITSRFMDKRGLMEQVELRYMPRAGHSGILFIEDLQDDKQYGANDSQLGQLDDGHRYLLHLRHQSQAQAGALRMQVDYTRVRERDYNYFTDFDPIVGTEVDSQLQQTLQAGYYQPQWNLSTEVRRFQILNPNAILPHEVLPQVNYNHYRQGRWFDFVWQSELTHFGYSDDNASLQQQGERYSAKRLHLAPTLTVPLLDAPGYYLTSQYKLLHTLYDQTVPDSFVRAGQAAMQKPLSGLSAYEFNALRYMQDGQMSLTDGTVQRTLPVLRLKGGLNFDRTTTWYGDKGTQTLEPEFQYLYVPYEKQTGIGLYDATTTRQDYYSLFSDRRFAGIDRISDANRVTLGVTSRLYDQLGDERLRLSLAQAFELSTPRVRLYSSDPSSTNSRSKLSFEGDARLTNAWFTHTGAQFDTSTNQFTNANGAIEYRHAGWVAQTNLRYIQDGNLDSRNPTDVDAAKDLSQAGVLLLAPVAPQWQLYGAYYRDLAQSANIDRKIGVKYDSCCWSLNFGLEWHNQPEWFADGQLRPTSEKIIGLQFEMKGLGSVGTGSRSVSLDTELLPYVRPFNLKEQP